MHASAVPAHAYDDWVHRLPALAPQPVIAASVLVVAALFAPACGGGTEKGGGAAGSANAVDLAAGEQSYMDFCGSCHGRNFEGSAAGPSQLDPHFAPETTSDDAFRAAITNGAPEEHFDFTPMPAIGSLDDSEIDNVIAYVRGVQEERGFND